MKRSWRAAALTLAFPSSSAPFAVQEAWDSNSPAGGYDIKEVPKLFQQMSSNLVPKTVDSHDGRMH